MGIVLGPQNKGPKFEKNKLSIFREKFRKSDVTSSCQLRSAAVRLSCFGAFFRFSAPLFMLEFRRFSGSIALRRYHPRK